MSNEQDKQHLQELASYRLTVENLRARVVELEAQLVAAKQGMDVTSGAIALCKHASKIQNIDFDDNWAIHSDEFKEEAQLVLDAAQAKQGEQANG